MTDIKELLASGKKVLLTEKTCPHCEEAKEIRRVEIEKGEIEVCECDLNAPEGSEARKNCSKIIEFMKTDNKIIVPTLYDPDGCEVEIKANKRLCDI